MARLKVVDSRKSAVGSKLKIVDDGRPDDEAAPDGEVIPDDLPGFYSHEKVKAYVSCCVDLARANDLTMVELLFAARSLLLATEGQLVKKAGEIVPYAGKGGPDEG